MPKGQKRSKHAPLECPECDKVCKPEYDTKDGGASYRCRNKDGHADSCDLRFKIDGDGELYF